MPTVTATERRPPRPGSLRNNRSQAVKRAAIAVTAGQLAIVAAARSWRRRFGVWPNAGELATAAEFTRPDVWSALKSLERLGIVRWRRLVEVVRKPDGIFFVPSSGILSRDDVPAPSTLWFPVQDGCGT